jgi:hypothetical protein
MPLGGKIQSPMAAAREIDSKAYLSTVLHASDAEKYCSGVGVATKMDGSGKFRTDSTYVRQQKMMMLGLRSI